MKRDLSPVLDGLRLGFVLSAGRTGTMFITDYLNRAMPNLVAVHEPWPSRWELVLGNARNRIGLGTSLLKRLHIQSRSKRLELASSERYIEVNPLLCASIDVLADSVTPLTVVHVVREPLSWAGSILGFKASGWRRHAIDIMPFAKPYPCPRPPGWRRFNEIEKCLWRWRYCNDQIGSLAAIASRYTLVRYEDLFSGSAGCRQAAFAKLATGLGLPSGLVASAPDVSVRVNRSSRSAPLPDRTLEMAREVCGPLAASWGYDAY